MLVAGVGCRRHCALFELRLADILVETDKTTAIKQFRQFNKDEKNQRTGTAFEIRQLDKLCTIALGEGLAKFVPAYFKTGVACLTPGIVYDSKLPPPSREPRPLLRVVADREKQAAEPSLFSAPGCGLWRFATLTTLPGGSR